MGGNTVWKTADRERAIVPTLPRRGPTTAGLLRLAAAKHRTRNRSQTDNVN